MRMRHDTLNSYMWCEVGSNGGNAYTASSPTHGKRVRGLTFKTTLLCIWAGICAGGSNGGNACIADSQCPGSGKCTTTCGGLSLHHTVAHCNTLQHTCVFQSHAPHFWRFVAATHCNTQEHTATYCNGIQDIYVFLSPAPPLVKSHGCNMLQCTATRCNTLQHTATHCDIHAYFSHMHDTCGGLSWHLAATHSNALRHTATECYVYTWFSHLHHHSWRVVASIYCNALQHTATHCNTLQHTAIFCSIHTLFSQGTTRCKGLW